MGSTKGKLSITFEGSYNEKELAEQFNIEYPMYFQYYGEALKAVLENIEDNALEDTGKNAEIYGCRDGKYGVPLYKSNIIAFAGIRGAGKTTAITEFGRILEEYVIRCEKWNREIYYQNNARKQCRFHVLPLIDTSALSAKEDLIEVILASMYHIVKKHQDGYKQENPGRDDCFRRLIVEFDNVYRDYLNVGSLGGQNNLGDSVLVKLRNVPDSLKLKASIEKLVETFLGLLDEDRQDGNRQNGNRQNGESYMVVTVDDLDMNPRSGFEMLDQLYKYFSNRRVIILAAFKYEQMRFLSQKNFVDGLIPQFGSTHYEVYKRYEGRAQELANDYLLKALPIANRIYLPERDKLYLWAMVEQEGFGQYDVKGFLLKKIVQMTNVYYDATGIKKHFCLPDTVRELVSYVAFLDSLYSLDEIEQKGNTGSERQMVLYDQNHERFNKDIEERMAAKILDDDQLVLYRTIMSRNIERRAGYMLCFIQNRLGEVGYDEKGRRLLNDSTDEQNFCYTDLMEVLYKLGRKDYKDKPLVHCILASFTSEMVREYYSYRHNKKKDAKERAARRLENFLGTTFGGEWLQKAMPKVIMNVNGHPTSFKACYIRQIPALNFVIKIEKKDVEWKNTEKWLTDMLLDNLPYVECISLMFANARDAAGRLIAPEWDIRIDKREEMQAVLTVKSYVANVGFDMFGFLGREMRAKANAPMYDERLFEAFEACASRYCDNHGEASAKENIHKKWKNKAKERTIWSGNRKNIAFPYYDFDMAYNVVKRVRRKMAAGASSISENKICDYYRTAYGYMAQYLKEEDDYYKKLFQKGKKSSLMLYENFITSPVVNAFGTQHEDSELCNEGTLDREKLNHYLRETIKSLQIVNVSNKEEENAE